MHQARKKGSKDGGCSEHDYSFQLGTKDPKISSIPGEAKKRRIAKTQGKVTD